MAADNNGLIIAGAFGLTALGAVFLVTSEQKQQAAADRALQAQLAAQNKQQNSGGSNPIAGLLGGALQLFGGLFGA